MILVKGKIKLNTFTKFGDEIDKVGTWAIKMTTISILESKIWSLVPLKKKKNYIVRPKTKTHDLFLVNIIEIRSINLYTFFFGLGCICFIKITFLKISSKFSINLVILTSNVTLFLCPRISKLQYFIEQVVLLHILFLKTEQVVLFNHC